MARTGIPHEQEMPAPVTTTIFLHLATARERFESDLRVGASDVDASMSSVIVIAYTEHYALDWRGEGGTRRGLQGGGRRWSRSGKRCSASDAGVAAPCSTTRVTT